MKLTALKAAVRRLERSDTPRKRAGARRALEQAVRSLQRDVDAAYPKLRDDGTAIVPRKIRGCACPVCRLPQKSVAQLVGHLRAKHAGTITRNGSQETAPGVFEPKFRCVCGESFSDRGLISHLAKVNILHHFAAAALVRSAGAAVMYFDLVSDAGSVDKMVREQLDLKRRLTASMGVPAHLLKGVRRGR